jgi:PAS domain S-box-containing protein
LAVHVLIVEDSEADYYLLLREFRRAEIEITAERITSLSALRSALERSWDIVLSDYDLSGFDGRDVLATVKAARPDLPVIVTSGAISEDVIVETLRAGAEDYVMKHNLRRLTSAVTRCIREAQIRREKQAAEQAQQELSIRLQTMADNVPALIWMTGPDQETTFYNRPWFQFVLGDDTEDATPDAVQNRSRYGWWANLHPDDREENSRIYYEAFAAREPFRREYRLCRHDGVYRWMTDSGMPFYRPDGTFAGYVGSCLDVTERKEQEYERFRLLREVIWTVTEGRFLLCQHEGELPNLPDAKSEAFPLTQESLSSFRHEVQRIGIGLAFPTERLQDFILAVGEVIMNAVVHGKNGVARVHYCADTMFIAVQDFGPGFELNSLHRATLERGYTTKGTMGMGFYLTMQTSDNLWLLTGQNGTTVVLEKKREEPSPVWLENAPPIPSAV